MTLEAGGVTATGTTVGVAALSVGDVVELGVLRSGFAAD